MPQVKPKKKTSSGTRAKNSALTNGRAKSTSPKNSQSKAVSKSASENGNLLQKFFVDSLKDVYWAEKHLTKALPKMVKATTNEDLKSAINEHLIITQEHVLRLEEVFEILGQKAQAKKCEAMAGITKEGESIIEETEKGTSTRDVGIIMAAQKVEHYEIATYGGLVQLAKILSMSDVAGLLAKILEQEKEADANLSAIAENHINLQAEKESEDETED